MLPTSHQRLLAELGDDALVLDVGGWAKPFARADWVIDLMPFETRGLYGYEGDRSDERFTGATWVCHDLCGHEAWPFPDEHFDFAICSHTLEDLRDPVRVCQELTRVARAGYVEVPSRLEEQTWGLQGPWAGWSHHRWLCEVDATQPRIDFVFKADVVHSDKLHFPGRFHDVLTPARRVEKFWWEESFAFRERIFMDGDQLTAWLRELIDLHRAEVPPEPPGREGVRRLAQALRRRLT